MLTKLIFTALVIAAVYALFRFRGRTGAQGGDQEALAKNRFGRNLSYAFAATLVVIPAAFFLLQRNPEYELVTVRVVNGTSGVTATYRARRPTIDGKQFVTADGRVVFLGASDRMEILHSE